MKKSPSFLKNVPSFFLIRQEKGRGSGFAVCVFQKKDGKCKGYSVYLLYFCTSKAKHVVKLLIIGSGNVATHVAIWAQEHGQQVVHVASRTPSHAQELARRVHASFSGLDVRDMPHAEAALVAVSDDALREVVQQLPPMPDTVLIHTAGGMDMGVFAGRVGDRGHGILYPLQSFSRQQPANFAEIPLFLEADGPEGMDVLKQLASCMSQRVYELDSRQRKLLHVAGVFAHNFSNHCMAQADVLLGRLGLPFDVLLPMMEALVRKLRAANPRQTQTGPAVRGDWQLVEEESELLREDKDMQRLYDMMSRSIGLFHQTLKT